MRIKKSAQKLEKTDKKNKKAETKIKLRLILVQNQ